MITNVDFLITTCNNPEGLTKLVLSIAERYHGAHIYIADTGRELDRRFYKELMAEASKAGLVSRIKAKHLGHNASAARVWSVMFEETPREYKLLLSDSMLFTDLTDINAMVEAMETEPKAVVINGADHEGQVGTGYADHVSTFSLIRKELFYKYSWQGADVYQSLFDHINNATTYHVYYCGEALISSSIIEIENVEDAQNPAGGHGTGSGSPTQPDVQSNDDNGAVQGDGVSVLSSGKNETTADTNTARRQRASNSRPVPRQSNK